MHRWAQKWLFKNFDPPDNKCQVPNAQLENTHSWRSVSRIFMMKMPERWRALPRRALFVSILAQKSSKGVKTSQWCHDVVSLRHMTTGDMTKLFCAIYIGHTIGRALTNWQTHTHRHTHTHQTDFIPSTAGGKNGWFKMLKLRIAFSC